MFAASEMIVCNVVDTLETVEAKTILATSACPGVAESDKPSVFAEQIHQRALFRRVAGERETTVLAQCEAACVAGAAATPSFAEWATLSLLPSGMSNTTRTPGFRSAA